MDDRRRDVALFRYSLIREAADPALAPRQRGQMLNFLASRDHIGPDGERVRVSAPTLRRWVRVWRDGGFEALYPAPRSSQPRTPAEVLQIAEALKREVPARTAAQVREIMVRSGHPAPSERTLQRHFVRRDLRPKAGAPRIYGRFEASAPNELWTGDALHGPVVAGRKTYLFAFIDDHSRALVGYRWGEAEDTLRLEAALRTALAARGVPKACYVDNGSAFSSGWLLRACAVLGIRLVHSAPGEPAGRGKIERVFRTVRGQFLVEVTHRGVGSLEELNRLFAAWVEQVYHLRIHAETNEPPLERFLRPGPPRLPTPAELREAFLWSEHRRVAKTATFSLYGNRYECDPALAGRTVELVFDPFDLTDIEVRYQGRSMGKAMAHVVGRHVHPRARLQDPPAPPRTGIDYLGLVEAEHDEATRRRITYASLEETATEEGDHTP